MMVIVNYQCCICGESIEKDSQADPCGITIFSNVDKSEDEQSEQTFFCHYECFKSSMTSNLRQYLRLEDHN